MKYDGISNERLKANVLSLVQNNYIYLSSLKSFQKKIREIWKFPHKSGFIEFHPEILMSVRISKVDKLSKLLAKFFNFQFLCRCDYYSVS